jgi:lysophospholipase L1-like esterase
MKTIVCFGDSNTWGTVPGSDGERFPREARWPTVLQRELGDDWEVIAEGLGGRTATVERPDAEGRNGLPYFLPCLHSHRPIDVLVIYLGTNDVYYVVDDDLVARCVARLVDIARKSEAGPGGGAPHVLVLCPPAFDGHELGPSFAAELDCDVLDLDGIASYPVVNGDVWHLDANGHAAIGTAVAGRIRATFG